ncbi:CCA tRNA nucleotidyltransferase [uncultured Fusobacterium sp.]|uniref:CCA tRNA nucleotidyltransferase n=1 Tax=uncultured Fusobacterium sp. TaxID=159267 RepID=UPI0025E8F0C5|nr:CCA tRNA nucleotidyltransferase [uncultured Fusobacterium sp.]
MKKINLFKDEKEILEILQKYGEGYIVGGYVRDSLLGIEPSDCDFVTNLDYSKLLEIFKDFSPKEIGKHFGIIQIIYNGKSYEIAKYRKDIGVPEDRKKQEVEFTNNIMEDLKRRDFTINAIAYDGKNFRYVEGAEEDLKNKTLRFVGDPIARIKEDPLRIMRFIRFLATKNLKSGFEIEKLKDYLYLLDKISMERIRDEFNKIILSKDIENALSILEKSGVLEYIIPEWSATIDFDQKNSHHYLTVDEHIKKVVSLCDEDLELRIAALLHDIGKPQTFTLDSEGKGHFYNHEIESAKIVESILKRMKYSAKISSSIKNLVLYHLNTFKNSGRKYVKKLINEMGKDEVLKLFKLMEFDRIAHNPPHDFRSLNELKRLYNEIIEKEEAVSIKDLKISGKDIIELGVSQGKEIGLVLKLIFERVLEDSSLNERKILIKLAKEIIDKKD